MSFQIRKMTTSDIPEAMVLKDAAGWNQVPEDWLGYMELEPSGCFVGQVGERVVSSATALSYDSAFGWIGMILVAPDFRRRGYATRMMEATIEYLESKQCHTQRLDATEAGAQVYRKFGFTEETIVERWVRSPEAGLSNMNTESESLPIAVDELAGLSAWDADAFGASRRTLLAWYLRNSAPSLCSKMDSSLRGFAMGRGGSRAYQLGPLVAEDHETASRLATDFLDQIPSEAVIADVSRDNSRAIELLEDLDFVPNRRLIRMFRGNSPPVGYTERVYFLAGFEFG